MREPGFEARKFDFRADSHKRIVTLPRLLDGVFFRYFTNKHHCFVSTFRKLDSSLDSHIRRRTKKQDWTEEKLSSNEVLTEVSDFGDLRSLGDLEWGVWAHISPTGCSLPLDEDQTWERY